MTMPPRLVIADDHVLFRQGLKSLLMLQPDIEVVAEVERSADLPAALESAGADIVLLDLQMDGWTMEEIPRLASLATVIVLTASESVENGIRALRLGARAIVHKRFAIETLMDAIHSVLQGHAWMPPALQTHFAEHDAPNAKHLSERETEVVRLVASGLRNAEVAARLSIRESTVKTHLNNAFQKLELRDRLELTRYAIRTGLVGVLDSDR